MKTAGACIQMHQMFFQLNFVEWSESGCLLQWFLVPISDWSERIIRNHSLCDRTVFVSIFDLCKSWQHHTVSLEITIRNKFFLWLTHNQLWICCSSQDVPKFPVTLCKSKFPMHTCLSIDLWDDKWKFSGKTTILTGKNTGMCLQILHGWVCFEMGTFL